MDTASVNREVKDKLFCYIFGNEENKQWTSAIIRLELNDNS